MQQKQNTSSRKKFIVWGAAVLTSLTALRIFAGSKKTSIPGENNEGQTVKMLTRDGMLVEVDTKNLFCGKRKKISDEQLKTWVNKK